jgi:hypothetical protein
MIMEGTLVLAKHRFKYRIVDAASEGKHSEEKGKANDLHLEIKFILWKWSFDETYRLLFIRFTFLIL